MKICHVVYAYFPQDVRPRQETFALRDMGYEVHVISVLDEAESAKEIVDGVHVHRVPLRIIKGGKARYLFQYAVFLLAATALLLRLQLSRRFDVVHVHSLPDFQVFCALPERIWGTRIILDLHEAMPELFAARFGLPMTSRTVQVASSLEKISCIAADRIIVVNDVLRDRLVKKGVPLTKLTVIMNSPALSRQQAPEAEKLREQLNNDREDAVVYVGGVNAERDLETLVRAVATVSRSHPLKLLIVGHGDERYRTRLREVARDMHFSDCQIMEKVPYWQVPSYIGLSVLGPVTYEINPLTELAMPTKALEYAAAHKPLVVANLRAIRGILGDAALYYRPGDFRDLGKQITWILEHPEDATRMADRAVTVLERCSWAVMESRLIDMYQVLSGGEQMRQSAILRPE